ncbi:MAG: IS110 family transposase [Acidobacteriia bacterium]|nr:IS110 family transposase [Terriglobia bacterium]
MTNRLPSWKRKYPEVARLQQIAGVGLLIWLTFVLTLDDHRRFHKSRQIGSYLGLRPKQRDSGESQPQLRIRKGGQVLVQSADSGSAVPIGKIRTGHGSETVGAEAGGARE